MFKKIAVILPLLALALTNSTNAMPESVKVGVKNVPPFSFKDDSGEWRGISVDLWAHLARTNNTAVEWVKKDSVPALLTALESQEIDLVASSLSLTSEREASYDFSHPFLSSNLAILAMSKDENPWLRVAKSFLSWPFFAALGSLSLVLLGAGAALYFFERRSNPEQFDPATMKGLGDSFWWAAVTMTTVGYGDKAPNSLGGRLIALVWMFLSVIILSTFTASIVSSLALPSQSSPIHKLADLQSGKIGTVGGSTSSALLTAAQLKSTDLRDLAAIKEAFLEGSIDGYVFDKPTLQYFMKGLPTEFYLVDLPNKTEDYAFVLRENSPMRESINRQLLEFLSSPEWIDLKDNYLN